MTSGQIRVLVVDDDFAVADVHRAYVENVAGFSVVAVAHTGAQALRAAEDQRPDLVLLDIHLPDMSGLEVLRRLRARPDGADVDILAITAAREVDTVRTAMAGGVADYLIKPFPLRVFRERLESYAAQRDKLRTLFAQQITVQDQREVDRLLSSRPRRGEERDMPKGLSHHTLQLVVNTLRDAGRDLSAEEAGCACGLARVSARRYLEHLVRIGVAEVHPRYGSAGRPENGYLWTGYPANEPHDTRH